MPKNKRIVVISAPSGGGKTKTVKTVLARLKEHPLSRHECARVVTSTTRDIRPHEGELHGTDYFFYTDFEFAEKIHRGDFVEYVRSEANGKCYGTEYASLDRVLNEGKIPILNIDLEGAAAIAARFPRSLRIFLKPGAFEDLEPRMEGRDNIPGRLEQAKREIAGWGRYCNCLVTNVHGKFDDTVAAVMAEIKKYLGEK